MKSIVKTFIGTSALSLFLVSASFAQDGSAMQDDTYQDNTELTQPQEQPALQDEQAKTSIAKEELPAEVNDAIQGSEYAEWTVAEAYEVKEGEEKEYEVHFANPEGELEKETFTKNGDVAK